MAHIEVDDLVCPICKKPLVLNAEQETLKCNVCRRVYPIRDNIPILLVDEAHIEE
ncbi:MAG: Trm112 family protein [Terriglobales bacterium]